MSIKALRRQLFAAIAMFLVALVAVSSATFAWFSMNTSVTAEHVDVTAASADPFLQIKAEGESDFSVAAHFTNAAGEGEELRLVSIKTIGATPTWYEAKSDDPNTAVTAYSATTEETVADGATTHMVKKGFTIKNASSVVAENLEANVTLTTPDGTKLDHAVRVLIVDENGQYVLFDSTGAVVTTAPTTASSIAFGDLTAGQELDFNLYVYFDGTDTLAKNVTEITDVAVRVTIEFTIKGNANNSATT